MAGDRISEQLSQEKIYKLKHRGKKRARVIYYPMKRFHIYMEFQKKRRENLTEFIKYIKLYFKIV